MGYKILAVLITTRAMVDLVQLETISFNAFVFDNYFCSFPGAESEKEETSYRFSLVTDIGPWVTVLSDLAKLDLYFRPLMAFIVFP